MYPTESIALVSMPYRWVLPKTGRENEKESSKAAPYLLGSPAYPDNYIAAILDAEAKFKIVYHKTMWLDSTFC